MGEGKLLATEWMQKANMNSLAKNQQKCSFECIQYEREREPMNSESVKLINETRRQALYLWVGLNLSLTLFFVQSQMFFVTASPLPTSSLEWVFSGLGLITFVFGFVFFKNYTSLRRLRLMKMPFAERKQSLLVAFVLQFVLFETLGLYGVLISVLTQNTMKAIPYILFAYVGFILAFPKKEKIEPFFKGG